jgi:hypothetical protein
MTMYQSQTNFSFKALCLSLITAFSYQAYSTELVVNGDFSSALGAEWSTAGNPSVESGQLVFETDLGVNDQVSQQITTEVGQNYIVSFDLSNDSLLGALVNLELSVSGSGLLVDQVLDLLSLSSDETVSYQFTADSADTTITLTDASLLSVLPDTYFIDNISVSVDTDLALSIIEAYADLGVTAPTLLNYSAAGVTGVSVDNLAEVNAEIDLLGASEVDTLEEIQAVVDQVLALNIIEAYADAGVTAPTLSDFATAGVVGVSVDNLADVNAAIDLLAASDADTLVEVQGVVDAVIALNLIETFANVGGAAPSLDDFADAGVIGVTVDNLAEVNAAIDLLDAGDVDTVAELQDIVDTVVALNVIEAYADVGGGSTNTQ